MGNTVKVCSSVWVHFRVRLLGVSCTVKAGSSAWMTLWDQAPRYGQHCKVWLLSMDGTVESGSLVCGQHCKVWLLSEDDTLESGSSV